MIVPLGFSPHINALLKLCFCLEAYQRSCGCARPGLRIQRITTSDVLSVSVTLPTTNLTVNHLVVCLIFTLPKSCISLGFLYRNAKHGGCAAFNTITKLQVISTNKNVPPPTLSVVWPLVVILCLALCHLNFCGVLSSSPVNHHKFVAADASCPALP